MSFTPTKGVRLVLAPSLILVIVSVSLYEGGVLATPSPTVTRTGTGGAIGPCTWFVSLDGTTPVAEAMIGGLPVGPGDNVVGTAGEDVAVFLNGLQAQNEHLCFSDGTTFSFGTTSWVPLSNSY